MACRTAVPGALLERCLAAFKTAETAPSRLQRQVAESVERLPDAGRYEVRQEVYTSAGYSLDIVVVFRGIEVAIEVDGPSHFLGYSEQPTGGTLLKRRQLSHLGWKVLPVPYWEYEGSSDQVSGGVAQPRMPHARPA
jgi:hypothetical protein